MALAETARLLATFQGKDMLTPTIKQMSGSLDKFDARVGKSETRAYKAGAQIGTGIKRSAAIIGSATVLAGAAVGGFFLKSIQAASDLNETVSKAGVVFGTAAKQVIDFGNTSADAFGISKNEAIGAAATFGNLFVSMGLAQQKSASMSLAMVKLASDLASFNNIDPGEALEKLRAGLTGEAEPLKSLGININETIIKAKALELGLVKNTTTVEKSAKSVAQLKLQHLEYNKAQKAALDAQKKYGAGSEQALKAQVAAEKAGEKLEDRVKKVPVVLTAAQKAQAAYALILEQSRTAQGDFSRTSDGLANQGRILEAQWKDVQATFAGAALPAAAKVMQAINKTLKENQPAIQKFGDNISALFSDANIAIGTKLIGDMFKAAQDAAPVLESAAGKVIDLVRTSVDMFRSLPPEIQALAVAGLAVNKLTGGLVTNIAGGLISAVISSFKGLMNVNAAVVNVNGGVGGVGGLAGAAGTAAGIGTGTALGLIAASVGATVIGSAQARSLIDSMVDDQALLIAAEAARKHGVPDEHNAALQKLRRLHTVAPEDRSLDADEKRIMANRSAFSSNPTRAELRVKIRDLKELKPTKETERAIKSLQGRLDHRIAEGNRKAADAKRLLADVARTSKAIVAAVDRLDIKPPVINVPVTNKTYINGREVNANLGRYTSVTSGIDLSRGIIP